MTVLGSDRSCVDVLGAKIFSVPCKLPSTHQQKSFCVARLRQPLLFQLGLSPSTLRCIMAPSFDADGRRRKRIFSLLVLQSTPEFRFYIQEYDFGAAPELIPPDPYDLANISVRRWKWLLLQYHNALKELFADQNAR